jgi:UDP-glucuronate 4-epimerase
MKILITGATGQAFGQVAEDLARAGNEVWCVARFSDRARRAELEQAGITTAVWDMGIDGLDHIPRDFTHVLHAATLRSTDDPEEVMSVNAVGTAMLMTHCSNAEAFLSVSTFGVYRAVRPDHLYAETDPVSGNTPAAPSYAVTKLVQEGVVRSYARTLGLKSVIARMNTAYGPRGLGGMPVRFFRMMRAGEPLPVPEAGYDEWHSPIHSDDLARQVPLLWKNADIVPPVVNWAGDTTISIRQMVDYITELTGVRAEYKPVVHTLTPKASDNTRRLALVGPCEVDWQDGLPRALEAHFPDALK